MGSINRYRLEYLLASCMLSLYEVSCSELQV